MPMFEWKVRSRHAGWLSAAIVAIAAFAAFAACSGGRSFNARPSRAVHPAPPSPSVTGGASRAELPSNANPAWQRRQRLKRHATDTQNA